MPGWRSLFEFGRRISAIVVVAVALAISAQPARAATGVPHDRWLEIDLYWFDDKDVAASAERFWTRYQPLFDDVEGYRGVILNLGMTVNYIMEYGGDAAQPIALPKGSGQELGAPIRGQLSGSTAERQAAWRERYRDPANHGAQTGYGAWSYGKLKALAAALRRKGAERGINNFKVGSLIVGMDGTYGELAPFARDHPEAWTKWPVDAAGALASSSHFDPAARLRADPRARAGLPAGIAEGMPVHDAFSAQWGALSRDIGLDALMLRDSMSFPRAYTRYGPFGETLPNAEAADKMTEGLAALIRNSKRANPRALIMMYSTGATATADWRANGIDLERIASEGYLDIFVDQTWAGAWNEVGVRQQTYWNAPLLGWTYQLAYMMQHAAVLAKSKVRHYFLTDTFDAWESWDTIHTAPERLRWAIWAYSHIAVKTPKGLRAPAGTYISWGNRGDALLDPADVSFLSAELNSAARDAKDMVSIEGPTVVYSRDVAAAQILDGAPRGDLRDRIDEQIGSIIKWPVPILSITRLEWLDDVQSSLFIFGNTKSLPDGKIDPVLKMARQGQPMAFFGSFGHSIHPKLLALANASAREPHPRVQDRRLTAELRPSALDGRIANFPQSFAAPPTAFQNAAEARDVVYGFGTSTGLLYRDLGQQNIVAWDPPPLADYWFRPLRDNMNGSPEPYALAAAAITAQLATGNSLHARVIDLDQPVAAAAWKGRDGRIRILAGNLEEGLRDDRNRNRSASFAMPPAWSKLKWATAWPGGRATADSGGLHVDLGPQGSILLVSAR